MAGIDGGSVKRIGRLIAGLCGGLVWVAMLIPATAGAQEVQAIICKEPAQLTLAQPANDSVVRDAGVPLSGTVRQATQLEVYVDTALDRVIPIGVTDTSFMTSVQLAEGTHTIRVVAVDICQIGNGEASAVVTYQPLVTQESSGVNVPTTIAGVRVGTVPGTSTPPSWPPASVGEVFNQVTDFLDINPVVSGATPQLPQVARFGLFTTGALMVMFSQLLSAAGITGKFALAASQRLGLRTAGAPRLLIVGIGVAILFMAFML